MRWIAFVVAAVGVLAVVAKAGSAGDADVATTSPARPRPATIVPARPATTVASPSTTSITSIPSAPASTLVSTAPAEANESDAPPAPDPTPAAAPLVVTNDPRTPAPAAEIVRPVVAIYGDSLTVLSEDRYHDIADAEIDSHVHAFAGASLPDHAKIILGDSTNRLVLALGTNDAHRDGAKPWIDFFDQLPASKCVVWPKPYEGSNEVRNFNLQVTAILAPHLNVHVIDWNSQAAAHPEWIGPDHVHYTAEGQSAYADMLHAAARTCP